MNDEGYETVKRSRMKVVTPKAKAVLERDDLGVGRSPARRLFVGEEHGEMRYVHSIAGRVIQLMDVWQPWDIRRCRY